MGLCGSKIAQVTAPRQQIVPVNPVVPVDPVVPVVPEVVLTPVISETPILIISEDPEPLVFHCAPITLSPIVEGVESFPIRVP